MLAATGFSVDVLEHLGLNSEKQMWGENHEIWGRPQSQSVVVGWFYRCKLLIL